jgi:hypothetical protein
MNTRSEFELIVGCPAVNRDDIGSYERRWLVVDENFVWQKDQFAQGLSQVQVSVSFGNLVMRAPGMLRLDLPMDVIEDDDSVWREANISGKTITVVDEGDLAAAWFGNVVGQPCRLVKLHPDQSTPAF